MTAHAPNVVPAPIPNGWRKTEANAVERRERNRAAPDVRAARAAILAETDARAEATREAETKAMRRPFELMREILVGATDEQIGELAVHAGRLNPTGLAQVAADLMVERRRARLTAATKKPAEGDEAVEQPAEPRRRRRG